MLHAALRDRWNISDQIQRIRPMTALGHRTKASVAITLLVENRGEDGGDDRDARFALATLRDLGS